MCLGIPGKIVEIWGEQDPLLRMGRVDFGGIVREVSLAYVPEALPGDYVIVHVGFALHTVDEQEAQETLKLLKEIDAIAEETGSDGP
jgi:hydrogenase expression/formation protein HypC